jgi:hypothetical protein
VKEMSLLILYVRINELHRQEKVRYGKREGFPFEFSPLLVSSIAVHIMSSHAPLFYRGRGENIYLSFILKKRSCGATQNLLI